MTDAVGAVLSWQSGMRFLARSHSGHEVTLDSVTGPEHEGPSPVELVVIGLAGCTAMDVVAILAKMRQELTALEVAVRGERADSSPKRLVAVELIYRLTGRRLSREKAERAVELSHSTYCAVLASLRADCKVTTAIEIAEA